MSLTVPVAPRIQKTSTPTFPQFVFEWHEHTGKVYMLETPGAWIGGQFVPSFAEKTRRAIVVAEHCEHHARFYGFVQTFLRGYRKGKEDQQKGGEFDVSRRQDTACFEA